MNERTLLNNVIMELRRLPNSCLIFNALKIFFVELGLDKFPITKLPTNGNKNLAVAKLQICLILVGQKLLLDLELNGS